ncbi:hypothetical protein J6524_20280 [Bradyrhizobium sp. WSM 1738]|uniref:hypothetical protein n=1 Tax=Bradyrhizobium hereditatis TaxID=2821405 RepID=UPI001CE370B1|nr:hypothetical protein [Bradyrhizobium hereditatis]MCA6117193.1 hypothetical protein [Bradyrhizobium hereditatis]
MNRSLRTIAAAMLLALYAPPVSAEEPPKFSDHRVKVYAGKHAKPRLDHEFWRDRGETYRWAMEDDKINAGGRFIVVILPCGSECQAPTFLDVRTGRITQFFTVSNWGDVPDEFEPVVSRADSRLIVFRGKRNEKGINGNHYYLIDDRGELKHVHTTDTGGDFKAALKAE